MGWMTGFEPATSGSTIRRSNQLSYNGTLATMVYPKGCTSFGEASIRAIAI